MTTTRKRGPRNKNEIISATIELLKEGNYSSLTIEGVAARSGVGKATIYRWWNNKAELVFDAFSTETEILFKFDHTKSIHENFVQQLYTLTDVLQGGVGRAMLTVIGEEKELAAAFIKEYLEPRRAQTKKMLQAGIETGEIDDSFPFETVLDMLYGPIYFQFILFNQVPDESYIENLVNQVMKGISNDTS